MMTHIVVFGDSVAAGFWGAEGGWVERLRDFLVQRVLEEEGETYESGRYAELYNLSISGDSSTEVLERFESELKPRLPSQGELIVLFAIGGNDAYYFHEEDRLNTEPEQFHENLERLIELSREYADRTLFLRILPIDESLVDPVPWRPEICYREEYRQQFASILEQVCEDHDVPVIDPLSEIDSERYREELLEDGIHPNTEGHRKIFEAVKPTVLEMLPD